VYVSATSLNTRATIAKASSQGIRSHVSFPRFVKYERTGRPFASRGMPAATQSLKPVRIIAPLTRRSE